MHRNIPRCHSTPWSQRCSVPGSSHPSHLLHPLGTCAGQLLFPEPVQHPQAHPDSADTTAGGSPARCSAQSSPSTADKRRGTCTCRQLRGTDRHKPSLLGSFPDRHCDAPTWACPWNSHTPAGHELHSFLGFSLELGRNIN